MWLGRRISFIVETAPEAFVLSLTTNDSLTPFSKDRLSLQIIHITMSTCHTLSAFSFFLSLSLIFLSLSLSLTLLSIAISLSYLLSLFRNISYTVWQLLHSISLLNAPTATICLLSLCIFSTSILLSYLLYLYFYFFLCLSPSPFYLSFKCTHWHS